MKILALVTDAFGEPGGIAQYNQDLFNALANLKPVQSITVLVRNGNTSSLPEKIEQFSNFSSKLAYAIKAILLAKNRHFDWVFCGHINLLPLAVFISKLFSIPIWLQLHGIDAWKRPSKLIDYQIKNVFLVTCVSRFSRRKFLKWANLDPVRVKVLPNTISKDFHFVDPEPILKRLNLVGKKIILTVGRLSSSERYKGHDRVIKCLTEIKKQQPEICYLIAGDGDDRPRLERLVVEMGVSESVYFLGTVSHKHLKALYSCADLFVMPSTGEGFGIVFLEAMACGTPALGLADDGSVDPLQDGNLGIVTTEEELCAQIAKSLRQAKNAELAQQVHLTFGNQLFESHLESLINRIMLHQPKETGIESCAE